MFVKTTLNTLLACAILAVPAPRQPKTVHVLFSSNGHGYVDPCG